MCLYCITVNVFLLLGGEGIQYCGPQHICKISIWLTFISTVFARYDQVLKTSHAFNVLDSRGFVGVTERARYFGRMRR